MSIQPLRRGFVLHRRDYRNSSLLLDLFTADEGRIACVAKGAKTHARGRSALASLLQPFQPLWVSWFGRGEVKTLGLAEAAGPSLALSGERLYCGFYLNELLLRLIERHDAQEGLFVFYQQALADLEARPIDAVLRRFELRLLEELGYALDLGADRRGAPVVSAGWYRYRASLGLERVPGGTLPDMASTGGRESASDAGPDPRRSRVSYVAEPAIDAVARGPRSSAQRAVGTAVGLEAGADPGAAAEPAVLINGATLRRLASGAALEQADLAPARALMRAALAPYLGSKPLRSRELFRRRSG